MDIHLINVFSTDFGIVLGCHIFVKEVTIRQPSDHQLSHSPNGQPSNGPSAHHLHPQPGDTLLTVNNVSTDGLTLKEVRKLIDASRDQLSILVRRHNSPSTSSHSVATPVVPNHKPLNTTVAGVEYSTMINKQQQQESAGGPLCASDNGTLSDGENVFISYSVYAPLTCVYIGDVPLNYFIKICFLLECLLFSAVIILFHTFSNIPFNCLI